MSEMFKCVECGKNTKLRDEDKNYHLVCKWCANNLKRSKPE